jgi:hypothetical protein
MQNIHLITRELINEMLTPEEEREWHTHTVQLPKGELEEAREHLVSATVIMQAMVRLMNEGATPECEAVQKLLLQNNQLTVRYHLRERLTTRGAWNESITRKVHAMGVRLVIKTAAVDGDVPEREVFDFCHRARKASTWGRALDAIAAEALALHERAAGARSQAALTLARRFSDVCETWCLGDPVLYGRWFIELGRVLSGEHWVPIDGQRRAAWTLLVDAVQALQEPAGMRAAAAW